MKSKAKTKNRKQKSRKNLAKIQQKSKRESKSNFPKKTGFCRICGQKGYTEWHHIISQGHAKKTKQLDLITNPGNVVELCKPCHDQTTASKSRYLLQKKENVRKSKFWHHTPANKKKVKS